MQKFVLFFIVPLAIFGNSIPENPPTAPVPSSLPSSPDPNNFVAQFEQDTGLSQIPLQGAFFQQIGDYGLSYDVDGGLLSIRKDGSPLTYNFSGSKSPTSVSIAGILLTSTYSLPQKTLTSITSVDVNQSSIRNTTWNYDDQGHLTSISQKSLPSLVSKFWQYDASGNVNKYSITQGEPPQTTTYSPPNWNPVVGASASSLEKHTPEHTFSPGKSGSDETKLFR